MAYAININIHIPRQRLAVVCTGNLRRIKKVRGTNGVLFFVDSGFENFGKHDCTRSLEEEEEWVW